MKGKLDQIKKFAHVIAIVASAVISALSAATFGTGPAEAASLGAVSSALASGVREIL